MPLTILAVGKKHESWVASGIEQYETRLKNGWTTRWVIIPHSAHEAEQARSEESTRLLHHCKPDNFVILLDERGKLLDSPELSQLISTQQVHGKSIVFIIGGAYGVDETVFQRADAVWSLSKLVFPHQLVRLILVEQLYRSQEIFLHHPYHHQ